MYVYVATNPALGAPITDVKATSIFEFGEYEPVLTMEGDHLLTACIKNDEAGGAYINMGDKNWISHDHSVEGNHLSFVREGVNNPYISDIMIAQDGSDMREAITKLFEAGYTDIIKQDLNAGAGGDYIYVGLKRTNDKNNAIYDIIFTNDQKKPSNQIGDYTLVSSIDLNDGAAGKYIYMYQKRTPDKNGQSPLTDISFAGKNSQSSTEVVGNVTYYHTVAENTSGDVQDLNQSCGFWSDHIYLVKHYYIEPSLSGSIIGTGSIVVIASMLVVVAVVCFNVSKKNRLMREANKTKSDIELETK